jgi:hypothetical protein
VGVGVAVPVGVAVGVDVREGVGDIVGVAVLDDVGVGMSVFVGVAVRVAVAVGVRVAVAVGVEVGVCVGSWHVCAQPTSNTGSGTPSWSATIHTVLVKQVPEAQPNVRAWTHTAIAEPGGRGLERKSQITVSTPLYRPGMLGRTEAGTSSAGRVSVIHRWVKVTVPVLVI